MDQGQTPAAKGAPDGGVSREESTSTSTSLRLLLAARHGNREALERLLSRVVPPLRRWAAGRLPRWARGSADTADLVQDAVLHTIARIDGFEPRRQQALQAYLRQAVRNRVRDEVRKHQRHGTAVPAEDLDLAATGPCPEGALLETERFDRLRAALASLDPDDQELVVARVALGYSYEQIALARGSRSPDAVRMAVARAIKKMASQVRHE